jgi:hypothetical protein
MMYSVDQLAVSLGLSISQIRRRLDVIVTDLNGSLHRGSRGKLLLSEPGLAILRRLTMLEKEQGLSCRDAVKVMREDLNGGKGKQIATVKVHNEGVKVAGELRENGIVETTLVHELRSRIADKEGETRHLEDEVFFSRERVRELTRLMPSKPRHRWWPFRRPVRERGE